MPFPRYGGEAPDKHGNVDPDAAPAPPADGASTRQRTVRRKKSSFYLHKEFCSTEITARSPVEPEPPAQSQT